MDKNHVRTGNKCLGGLIRIQIGQGEKAGLNRLGQIESVYGLVNLITVYIDF